MSNYQGKANVSVAQQSRRNKFDLSHSHITTMDFYQARPVTILEVEPNATIDVNMSTTVRCSAMITPMYGDVRVVNRAFFVPMRTIMGHFNEFITNAPCTDSYGNNILLQNVPSFSMLDIIHMFDTYEDLAEISTNLIFDFTIYERDLRHNKRLTVKGKMFFNILNSLGYRCDLTNGGQNSFPQLSALPLLAYARIFFDWFRNSNYNNLQWLLGVFENVDTDRWIATPELIYNILNAIYRISYNNDYFVSAFDNPLGPNAATTLPVEIFDPSTSDDRIPNIIGTPDDVFAHQSARVSSLGGGPIHQFSDFAVKTVHKLQDWLNRKNIAGTRALDRYMNEFGVQLESSKLNRCIYLGKNDVPLQISDVMQTSPYIDAGTSDNNGTGDYTGKGFGVGGDHVTKFTTDEFGFFIIMSYIEPRVSYPFGRDRFTHHVNFMDFFTPEFDGLGNQAISLDEISAGNMKSELTNYHSHSIFGWTPRFAEYKVKHDNITGDIVLPSHESQYQGWYLTRDLRPDTLGHGIQHDYDFTLADGGEFNQIFFEDRSNFDHFFLRYIFKIDKYSQMKPLYDMYDFEDQSRTINQEIGGTKVTN